MIGLLNLSIFVISASLIIANHDFTYGFRRGSSSACRGRRCLKYVNKLKSQIQELLETHGEWGSWSDWSDCRSTSFCGKGFTTRNRSCTPHYAPDWFCQSPPKKIFFTIPPKILHNINMRSHKKFCAKKMIFRGVFGLFYQKYPKGGPLENFEKKTIFFLNPP